MAVETVVAADAAECDDANQVKRPIEDANARSAKFIKSAVRAGSFQFHKYRVLSLESGDSDSSNAESQSNAHRAGGGGPKVVPFVGGKEIRLQFSDTILRVLAVKKCNSVNPLLRGRSTNQSVGRVLPGCGRAVSSRRGGEGESGSDTRHNERAGNRTEPVANPSSEGRSGQFHAKNNRGTKKRRRSWLRLLGAAASTFMRLFEYTEVQPES
jgi:hypothetical protein